jgi:hypothetical protein
MDKSNILLRLEKLVDLCEETESDLTFSKNYLFSKHLIEVQNMITLVTYMKNGGVNFESGTELEQLTEVMKSSNRIWRFRNRIKNGELEGHVLSEMIDEIEDYLAHGQKINAIKYYREEMKVRFGDQVSLRKSKDFVDDIHEDMKRKGICK